ncbi:MAG: hypothetical protein KJ056_06720 [Acidimicrobiia bacterium]|nr:hypothetical protein [Acidimicrobiia bacterium]
MARRIRRIAFVAGLIALIAGAGYLVLDTRTRLEADQDRVEARWSDLSPSLAARYEHLGAQETPLDGPGARDRDETKAIVAEIQDYFRTVAGEGEPDPGAVSVANELEGLTARARAVVAGSRRLQGVAPVTEALAAVDAAPPPLAEVAAFNAAVQAYEGDRSAALRAPIAPRLGFDRRDTFQTVTPA